eukprot:TRINITY_DN58_c0_g1_i2.p1 TRINITY_DN58_c0_g1~~TRINITY_DN58_c0_g1_i2.p1  ORF type:complete len:667 (+),score=161.90 TRINITY_DN58_c0_g1_i2:80-2002(+)
MAQEIGAGKMPHNDQIVSSIKEFEAPLGQQAQGTGAEARIAQHTQSLLQHTREMFQDKNSDNTLQNIHSHTVEASKALAEGAKEGHSQTIGQEQGKWTDERVLELRSLLQAFRKTATALARNNSFRSDLIEAIQLFQTLIFDITHSAIDKKLTQAKTGNIGSATGSVDTTPIIPAEGGVAPNTTTWKSTDLSGTESSGAHGTITPASDASSSSGSGKMSEEEKQHAFEKLRKIMQHLGHTSEYKELIEQLTNFFQHNGQQIMTIANSGKTGSQTALSALSDDIQTILEKFSGDVSLTPLRERTNTIVASAQHDAQVKAFFEEWRVLLRETITTPEEKDPKELDAKFQELSRNGKALLQKPEYRSNFEIVTSELRSFLGRIKEDTHLQNIGTDVESLRREIMLNEKGQLDFGQVRKSLPALKNVLIPSLTAALKTIPVPPIKSDDEKYALEVSNLSLAAQDLVPDNVRLHFANDLYFDFSGSGNDRFDSALSLALNDFHATLRDLQFKYERKKMPKMTDAGVADIEISGMTLRFRWLMEKNNEKLTFTCDKVRVQIRDLNTTVKEAQHKMLDKIALRLFNTQIKRGIEQSTEKALKERLGRFEIDTSTGVPVAEQLKMGASGVVGKAEQIANTSTQPTHSG